jgi:hypothetical protein
MNAWKSTPALAREKSARLLNTPLTIPLLVLFPVVLGIFSVRHIGRPARPVSRKSL